MFTLLTLYFFCGYSFNIFDEKYFDFNNVTGSPVNRLTTEWKIRATRTLSTGS